MWAISFGISKQKYTFNYHVEKHDQEAKAVKTKLLASDKPIILIRCFSHKSTKKFFEAAGIRVLPFPVDYKVEQENLRL